MCWHSWKTSCIQIVRITKQQSYFSHRKFKLVYTKLWHDFTFIQKIFLLLFYRSSRLQMFFKILNYWSFHLLAPLIVGWSAIWYVTGLMVFLHVDLPLARLTSRCFLRRSALTISFRLNIGLPWYVGPSTLKLMIFFVHDVSSARYKWRDSLSLFYLRTSSIW